MKIEIVEVIDKIVSSNPYHVPQKKWREWNREARIAFNRLYGSMQSNQYAYQHPKQELMSRAHWKTVCWNAAWTAADNANTSKVQDIAKRFAPALRRLANGK